MENEKRQSSVSYEGSHHDYFKLALIIIAIVAVVGTNIGMVFGIMSRQIDQVGEAQLDKVGSDLETTITDAEHIAMRVAIGAEQIGTDERARARLDTYIRTKKTEYLADTDGVCFNIYGAGSGWQILTDFDAPESFHPKERVWYKGAAENPGNIYISEPYIDVVNGITCFTASMMLSDNDAVIAADFTLSGLQDSVKRMLEGHSDRQAIIVTGGGTIVGYNDMDLAGTDIRSSLPEYADVFERVVSSKDHSNFRTVIDGASMTVFSAETSNEWYLILCFNTGALYSDSYVQLIVSIALNLFMVLIIVLFYTRSVKNRVTAQRALAVREDFLSSLSGELRAPLNRLLKKCDTLMPMADSRTAEGMSQIKESGLQLSEMLDSLFTYSAIVSGTKEADEKKKKHTHIDLPKSSRFTRNSVIIILVLTMLISQVISIYSTYGWGKSKIEQEALRYEDQVIQWDIQQQSILNMFATTISKHPDLIEDYDKAVAWLDSIACEYPEISVCYVANPYKEHEIIMNNGWVPPEGWSVEERPWYIATEKSPSGFNLSVPYYDDQTGNYCITMSKIILGQNNEFLGVFGIDYFIDKLINVLGESYTKYGYAFLVDADGKIINHPNPEYQMRSGSTKLIADTMYSDMYYDSTYGHFNDYDGSFMTGIARKNLETGFTVIVVNNWWNIYGNMILFGALFFVLFGVCIVAVSALIDRLIKWQEEANNKLKEAADLAVSAVKARSDFLAQMSHEIRTPINAVLGLNEMILRESTDREILEYASNIGRAGNTLLSLINSILDFSKLESGKMEIIPVSYDVLSLLDDIIIMTKERALKKGLEFKLDIDPTIPKNLYGDDVRLKQIIVNIMTNALKYTHEGSVSLTVSGTPVDDEVYELSVKVADTGIGIKEEDIEKLFHSFERLDEVKNRNIEGTGLGISIVQQLLAMMGSRLEVESEYGKGSVFSFRVKQKTIDHAPIGSYEEHVSSSAVREKAEGGGFTAETADVLVVDDNSMNLMVAKGLMKRLKIVPDLAESGKACMDAMRKKHYDIVFLDHMMPGMDGVETLHRLKAEDLIPADTVMVALTANAISGAKEFYLGEGFADYLSKPIEVRQLEKHLHRFLPAVKVVNVRPAGHEDPVQQAPQASEPVTPITYLGSKGYNTAAGVEYAAGSEEFYVEMLNAFTADHAAKSAELKEALDGKDWNTYRAKVHALKSTARMLGADALADLAFEHENAAKEEREDFITEGYAKLDEMYSGVCADMEKACGYPLNNNT